MGVFYWLGMVFWFREERRFLTKGGYREVAVRVFMRISGSRVIVEVVEDVGDDYGDRK